MANLITNLTASTELEAVNSILAAGGIAPLADLSNVTATDVLMAVNALRNASREVQTEGWKFNTEWGLQITRVTTMAWVDPNSGGDESPDGASPTIGVFLVPANLIKFYVTANNKQVDMYGNRLDFVARPSRRYVDPSSGAPVLVFYDRVCNRDGFPITERTNIWIDPVWYFDFTQLPEVARQYITVLAGRRFLKSVIGASELIGFQEKDELLALRRLSREEGLDDDFNMLDHPDVFRVIGDRPRTTGNFPDDRRSHP